MEKYLKSVLGVQVEKKGKYVGKDLPKFFSTKYEMSKYSINDFELIFVKQLDESMNFSQLKKHFKMISEVSKFQCALSLQRVTAYQRKKLIEQRISFVVAETQIYLPFIGIVLSEKYQAVTSAPKKMSPSTQLVFLHLFYQIFDRNEEPVLSLSKLSKDLKISTMTVSRSIRELNSFKLVDTFLKGREKLVYVRLQRHEFLHRGLEYFQNPISKTLYFPSDLDLPLCGWKSGISALSEATMIAEEKNDKAFGVYSFDDEVFFLNEIPSTEKVSFYEFITVEKWKYDVKKLGLLNDFDYVSIIFILEHQDSSDARIQTAILDLKERFRWW